MIMWWDWGKIMDLNKVLKEVPVDCDEKYVKNRVKELFKHFDGCYWFMPAANGFGRGGVPDFVGCYKSKFFSVECKAPARSKNVSALQKIEGQKIQASGGAWFVAYDANSLAILHEYLDKLRG